MRNQTAVFDNTGWFPDAAVDMLPVDMAGWQSMPHEVMMDFSLGNIAVPAAVSNVSATPCQTLNIGKLSQPLVPDSLPTPESSGSALSVESTLPSLDELLDAVEFFFERFYDSLPIIHKHTLVSTLREKGAEGVPNVLLYAILAITSSSYPHPRIQANSGHWYALAKSELAKVMTSSQHPHQTLQASLLVVYESVIKTEFNNTWLILGEAWRKAVAIGYNQHSKYGGINQRVMFVLGSQKEKSWIEMEEARRIVWSLFMFDRGLCFPVGIVHAIDDRRLVVKFPMSEEAFQGIVEPEIEASLQHTRDLDRLITSVQGHTRKGAANQLQYIILAYIFLGRVTEEIYGPDFDYETQREALDTLTDQLVRIRLMLPHSAVDVGGAGYAGSTNVIWLVAMLSSAAILLHHRPLCDGETIEDSAGMAAHWPHCVRAARDVVRTLRDASRASSECDVNSHMITALYVSFQMLLMEYYCPSVGGPQNSGVSKTAPKRDPTIRADIETVVGIFERLRDSRDMLGKKYYNGAKYCLHQDDERMRQTKARGGRDLLTNCASWYEADDGKPLVIRD